MPSDSIPVGGPSETAPSGTASSIQQSEKERTESITKGLPPPNISSTEMIRTLSTFIESMGIDSMGAREGSSMGTSEHSIIMSVIADAQKTREAIGEDQKVEQQRKEKTVGDMTQTFLQGSATTISASAITLKHLLTENPALLNFQNVAPDMIVKAYQKAEATLISKLLDNWTEMLQKQLKLFREQQLQEAKFPKNPLALQLEKYMADIRSGDMQLSQPQLSFIMSTAFGTQGKENVFAVQSQGVASKLIASIGTGIASLQTHMPGIAKNLANLIPSMQLSISNLWTMPVATSLLGKVTHTESLISKSSAQAYAMTLFTLVGRKDFDQFIVNTILKNVPKEKINDAQLQKFTRLMKVMLLSNALAALDKISLAVESNKLLTSTYSGDYFRGLIENPEKIDKKDFRYALAQEIHTLLKGMSKEERKQIVTTLKEFFDDDPDVDTLINPSTSIFTMIASTVRQHLSSIQPG